MLFRLSICFHLALSSQLRTPPGKPAKITAKKQNENAIIWVIDRGPGIPDDKHNLVFERFERANSPSNISGLGIGLFVAKRIIEAHGGEIRLESSSSFGSKFTIQLPLESKPEEKKPLYPLNFDVT